jgi:four helix bundle protein
MDGSTAGRIAAPEKPGGPTGLRVVEAAVDVARDLRRAMVPARWRSDLNLTLNLDLRDQAVRAADSVALNLAEGAGRGGRDKAYHYRVAYASAGEAVVALRLLTACGEFVESAAVDLIGRFDQIRAPSSTGSGRR